MEMTPKDRLVRKRNTNLQKQLEVNLQILGEEYRQTKERMYKDERECGVFLQSLYSTVPGLQTYGQPDTRAMNKNALLKERRYSVSISGLSGDESDDDYHHHHNYNHHHNNNSNNRHHSFTTNNAHPPQHKTPTSSSSSVPFNRRPQPASFPAGAGAPGASPQVRPKSGKQEEVGGVGRVTDAPPRRPRNRPSTAGAVRSDGGGGGMGGGLGRGVGGGSLNSLNARRPSTGLGHHDYGPHYGRNAYSEHDRSAHENVIQKFQFIFHPGTKARNVNLSTMATPIVVVQPESDDTTAAEKASKVAPSDQNGEVIQVNGEQYDVGKRPLHKARRVVWSAHPRGRQGTASAPTSARVERPGKGGASTKTRPASSIGRAATAVNGSSAIYSASLSLLNQIRTAKAGVRSDQGSSPVRLDPKIQALAHQRSFPADYAPHVKSSEPDDAPADDKPAPVSKCRKKSSHVNTVTIDSCSAQDKHRTDSPSSPVPNVECMAEEKDTDQLQQKVGKASRQRASSPRLKPKEPTKKQSATPNVHPNSKTPNPANQLQVPGNRSSNSSQPQPHHHQHHQHHETNGSVSRWSLIAKSIKRNGRSTPDAGVQPPTELLARLMRAGSKPGSENKQHKSAPSKSELRHRSMPAPRQTVAGILAQIENQKASTRHMLSESRDLQKVVKKLVPWEQHLDDYDYDDL